MHADLVSRPEANGQVLSRQKGAAMIVDSGLVAASWRD